MPAGWLTFPFVLLALLLDIAKHNPPEVRLPQLERHAHVLSPHALLRQKQGLQEMKILSIQNYLLFVISFEYKYMYFLFKKKNLNLKKNGFKRNNKKVP